MFISLSAVDRDSGIAFMKLLLAYLQADQFDYDAQFKRKLTRWMSEAEPFIKRFKIPTKDLKLVYAKLMKDIDPDDDQQMSDAIDAIAFMLNDKRKDFDKEHDLSKDDVKFLNDLRLVRLNASESALARIGQHIGRFKDPDLSTMFVTSHTDTSSEQDQLRALVKKHGGTDLKMPTEVSKKWSEHNKKKGQKLPDHVKYLALTKTLRESFKSRLSSIVRSSGKDLLPVRTVIDKLDDEEIPHTLPFAYIGLIDDQGKFYTTAGKKLLGAPSGDIRMNINYDPKSDNGYVCEFLAPYATGVTRSYTEEFRSRAKQKKFSVVGDTLPKLGALAKKWRSQMGGGVAKKETILATLCEFIYSTSARVGNRNAESKGIRTFGATQLQVQHFVIDDHKIVVRYQGKSAGKQHHIIRLDNQPNKRMAKNLQLLMKGKGKSDSVFTFKDKVFTGSTVTRYMTALGFPAGFTVHKLRTARATKMARDLLKKHPFKKGTDYSDRDVSQWVEGRILEVGKELGHMSGEKYTANTAIQNYIEPEMLSEFFEKLGVRPSAKIQKAIDAVSKH